MHRLFSLFVVLLLVFRGLLGDAMAMNGMAMAGSAAHGMGQAHAAAEMHMGAASHAEHAPQHAHAGAPAEACAGHDAGTCDPAHGAACAACGICHSAASLTALALRAAEAPARIRPEGRSAAFASALPQPTVKPPIS